MKVLIPDGYFMDGTTRPWVLAYVLYQQGNSYRVETEDGYTLSVPVYSVLVVPETL